MACTVSFPAGSHDRLRLDLMSAGLQMWHSRDQPDDEFPEARDRLVEFCVTRLLSHLEDDERWLLEAQHCPEGRLLAEAMRAEARTMMAVVDELATTTGHCEAMAQTRVLHTILAAHDHHERLLRTAAATS